MNKTFKSLPQKLTRPLLLVLLMSGGGAFFSQEAISDEINGIQLPPGQIQEWKDYLKNYPQILAEYYKRQNERRKYARQVFFSKNLSMSDTLKAYPFMQEDFQRIGDMQNRIANSPPPDDATTSVDLTVHVRVAQDQDKTGNLLFVEETGTLACGTRGCPCAIFVDHGKGYQKLTDILILDTNVYVSRAGGQTSLFLSPPLNDKSVEWVLRGNQLVIDHPPPSEPQSQAFVMWRHEMTLQGQDPEANIPSPDHEHESHGDDHETHDHAPEHHQPLPDDTLAPPEQ
jgi:hypothetical protein